MKEKMVKNRMWMAAIVAMLVVVMPITSQSTTYSIIYNANGGTLPSNSPSSFTVESPAITLPRPAKTGYGFNGWYENFSLTGNTVTTIPSGSVGNKTYWAKWTPITYSITYNLNSGTLPSGAVNSFTIESQAVTLPTPTRNGL